MRYLCVILFTSFITLYGQEPYHKNRVEGYILKADIFNDSNYLDPTIEDIACFETILKREIPGFRADFYRQYYSRKNDGKKYLFINMVKKTEIKEKEWLKNELYIVIDGCESIRFLVYDIAKQKIVSDKNGGGCGS